MILKGNEDPRVRRTITAIKETFLELIRKKPYEKITVSELSDLAEINKKTFYYYYKSLNELLLEMQDELLDEYLALLQKYNRDRGDLESAIDIFFRYFVEKGDSYIRIICQDKSGVIYRKILDLDCKHGGKTKFRWEKMSEFEKKSLIMYLNASILNALDYWSREQPSMSLDDAIQRAKTLSLTGVYGLLGVRSERIGRNNP